ncbi:PIN domain-containing protein [Candidatus Poribacteria bacterium]|nr:PIN domain-containing protein [Candidatus Poribacteria bacterium]
MKRYITDTHPLIWALSGDSRLSPAARSAFAAADTGRAIITIPSVVAVEMIYLSEKGRISTQLVDNLLADVSQPDLSYRLGELDAAVIVALRQIPRHLIPDMPDRIIAATPKALGIPLITRDAAITASGMVSVIW